MVWSNLAVAPHTVNFKLAPSDGLPESSRVKLSKQDNQLIRQCPFTCAIYIVFCNNEPQYVGQSGNLAKRFIDGVNFEEDGYIWPKAGLNFTVHIFQGPSDEHLRTAVEIEVMLLLRMYTGHWPIESAAAQPFHQLKITIPSSNAASKRARDILEWLIKYHPKFADTTRSALFSSFDQIEYALGRR